jgi:hypothetical protein
MAPGCSAHPVIGFLPTFTGQVCGGVYYSSFTIYYLARVHP